jgi:hypothetical protein
MSLSMVLGPSIVVASGSANSDPIIADHTYSDSDILGVLSPATLPETANLQISPDFNVNYKAEGIPLATAVSAATWVDADSTNAALGTAGQYKIIQTSYLTAAAARVHLNGNAAANRTFKTYKRMVI